MCPGQFVGSDFLELRSGLEDGGDSLFACQIELAVGKEGRRGEVAADPFDIDGPAGESIETSEYAGVVDHVDLFVDEDRARVGGNLSVEFPDDVGGGDIAGAAWLDCPELWLHVSRTDIDQPVAEQGTRDVGETLVLHLPEWRAGGGVVPEDLHGAWADEFLVAVDVDHQGGGVGFALVEIRMDGLRAILSPNDLTSLSIQCDDILLIDAVGIDDEKLAPEDGRASGTFFVVELNELIFPDDFSGRAVEARGAHGAERDIDVLAVMERTRRRVRVLCVEMDGFGGGEDFDIMLNRAGIEVQRDRAKGVAIVGRGGEPNVLTGNDRGGPTFSFNGALPNDVGRFTPLGREVLGIDVPTLSGRATKVGPSRGGLHEEGAEKQRSHRTHDHDVPQSPAKFLAAGYELRPGVSPKLPRSPRLTFVETAAVH